ncbi:UDP-N-acetylmuramoyl-L-alanyl-D-glutamate--2,6-diaminopimelate ligase [Arcobacter sp. 31_11_sub10_T18]|nr:UDP-N-acetylmuramoyl-L-alanyl-D-glutamate--2,6-diaminopimelate ligase [Arcobacter sp. 31_11_sub10_T18]
MIITINNKQFSDNSQETSENISFVYSSFTEKFISSAKDNGCIDFISACDLKNKVDFSSIQIVGITGTNGKTTTAAAIYSILLDLGFKVALQGTRGFFINDERIEEYSLTTPVQLSNFEHILKAQERGCDFFIMEVSSHAIVQKRIEGLDFSLKILTNITRDHLDYHHTIEEYIAVKNSFFTDDSPKLINKDEKNAQYNVKNGFAYSLDEPSTYKVQAYSFKDGMDVALNYFGETVHYSTGVTGVFNIYNLTASIAACHILSKKPLQEICDTLENFAGVSGRMETISTKPFIVVDFAHTPDGMQEVLKSYPTKDITVVFGAGGDRDKEKRPLMGRIAFHYAKKIIVTSDNPRFEDPDLIIEDILKGIPNLEKVEVEVNRKLAIKKAIECSSENSVILVLGKGDEEYQTIYDKKLPFNDKNIINEVLSQ